MANNRFITTKSNYTIKETHKKLDGSTIYERDYMATTNLGGFDSGVFPYSEGNFKIITTDNETRKKRHKNGNWLINDGCVVSTVDDCTVWTLDDLSDTTTDGSDDKIVTKPNQKDFTDFVYFGSCVELLKVSFTNILKNFPAELYISNLNFGYNNNDKSYTFGKERFDNPVILENPMDIDIISKTMSYEQKLEGVNTLRFFSESFSQYMLLDSEDNEICCLDNWTSEPSRKNCFKDGDLTSTITLNFSDGTEILIYSYYLNGQTILITDGENSGYKIRPKKTLVNEIFETKFSSFEKFLINRDSIPLNTITIKTPKETDRGISYTTKSYTWPTRNGWNIDVESNDYQIYVNSLLEIAEFYDEHNTDNLWKNMTHDAIKNLDITMNTMSKTDEDSSDYEIGVGNIRGLMLAYGRQFDEIKLAIDNIKATNNVTYDEGNNLPDYFLSDTLNLSGWEINNINGYFNDGTTVDDLFAGNSKEYDVNAVNVQFLRNLRINSKHILKRKGTRNCLEMLLSLFGLCSYDFGKNYYECLPQTSKPKVNGGFANWDNLSAEMQAYYYDYKINEYVVIASNEESDVIDEGKSLSAETYNTYKKDAYTELNTGGVSGLPVKIVSVTYDTTNEDGETESKTVKYLIPWFDKKVALDGSPYFQMYGGWMQDENGNYEETKQYLSVVSTIQDLLAVPNGKLNNGDIYYVNDISDISKYGLKTDDPSNYFKINKKDYSNLFTTNEKGDGWFNIPQDDIDNDKKSGMQVLRLENIIETSVGNNPHVGYNKFDSGEEYLNFFRQIFKGAIDNNDFTDEAYDCDTGTLLTGITNAGFKLSDYVVDNMKCWFFSDSSQNGKIYRIYKKYVEAEDEDYNEYNVPIGYEEASYETTVSVGKNAVKNSNREVFFETNLETFNFENQTSGGNDEASANSIINTKRITLEFNKLKYADNSQFKNFFHNAILPYLKQVIPSSTIVIIINIDSDSYTTEC